MKSLLTFLIIISISASICYSQKRDISSEEYIIKMENIAWQFYEKAEYDSAEYYYKYIIELNTHKYGYYSEETAGSYLNLGSVYNKIYNLKKSLEIYNICQDIYEEISPNSFYLGFIYNNKGNIYYTYADFDEAKLYYENSLNHFIKIDSINNDNFDVAYLNLLNTLLAQNRTSEVEELIENIKSLHIEDSRAFKKHMFLAQAYEQLGNIELAKEEYMEAEKYIESSLFFNSREQIQYNYRLASILTKEGKYSEAINLLMNSLQFFKQSSTTDFKRLAETYALRGEIYMLQGEYKNGYNYLTESIEKLNIELDNSNLDSYTISSRIISTFFVDLKHLLSKSCTELYSKTNDPTYLEEALDLYSEIIEMIKVFRIHMKNESSKLRNTAIRVSIVQEAINLAMRLYNLTGDTQFIDKAFQYAENTKSFVLLSEIKSTEAIQFADLPKEILEKESLISNEISAYEEMIYSEKTRPLPDTNKLRNLNNKFFTLKDEYNTLQDYIEQNYPKYYNLKYNSNFISTSEVKERLERNECLVEYVLSDSVLTTFVIDKENIEVLNRPVDSDFSQKCFDYYSLLQNQDFSNNVHQTYGNYTKQAREFYEILVRPVLEITDSREITFVPDGEIMYLPFESFLTSDHFDKTRPNYRDLPYLIYDVSVGYSYSSTLLFSERIRSKSPNNKVLAFAPEYKNLLDEELQSIWNRQSQRDFLMPLPGAKEEVKNIAKTVSADVYLDSAASESNFKEHASDYSVLHLAMHTIMDDENPMYSKLAFTRNFSDSTEDHDLFTYEIYNLPLNADMVVLSSCSSGYGKMQKGEGMMSMARGFIYAGCPSIVMTLWQVSDLSSAELMSNFYKYLKKGSSKKKALRQAKIDYIQSSDNLKANPYFWSAFLMVGDNTPLYSTSGTTYLVIILVAFTLILIGVIYTKQIRSAIQRKK